MNMKHRPRYPVLFASAAVVLVMVSFVINQTEQSVRLANSVNPVLGAFVLYGLLLIYAVIVVVPVIMHFRIPSALHPPGDIHSEEYKLYSVKLKKRLSMNKYIVEAGLQPDDTSYIEKAYAILDSQAKELINSTASKVFVINAISQNGHLDPLVVFINQVRLIRNIAHVYNPTISIREIVQLYMYAASVLCADSSIEDVDIEKQIEPIIGSVVGYSVMGGVPGTGGFTTFMTKSIIDGSVNALLTLKVGLIAGRFFSFTQRGAAHEEYKLACSQAGNMLNDVVMDSTGKVTKHAVKAFVKASKKHVSILGETLKDTAIKSAEKVGEASRKKAKALFDAFKKPPSKQQ